MPPRIKRKDKPNPKKEILHENFNLEDEFDERERLNKMPKLIPGKHNSAAGNHAKVFETKEALDPEKFKLVGTIIHEDGKGTKHYFYIDKRRKKD